MSRNSKEEERKKERKKKEDVDIQNDPPNVT